MKKKHGQNKSSNLGRLRLQLHLSLAIGEVLGRQRVPSTYHLQTSRTRLAFCSPRSLRPSVPSPGVSHLVGIGTVWAQVPQYLTLEMDLVRASYQRPVWHPGPCKSRRTCLCSQSDDDQVIQNVRLGEWEPN